MRVIVIVRRDQLDEVRRKRLMKAAIEEFAERGFEGASYNKIIERSGLSKGTVYYYFDNKETLLSTVFEDICDRFLEMIGEEDPPPETVEAYWNVARKYHERTIRFFLENPSLTRVIFMLHESEPLSSVWVSRIHERTLGLARRRLEQGQKIGAVREDIPAETLGRLIHTAGEVLCRDLLGERGEKIRGSRKNEREIRARIDKTIFLMHDLTARILVPGGMGRCSINC